MAESHSIEKVHPIDRMAMTRHHIMGVASLCEYAVEKIKEGDGPTPKIICAGLSAIGQLTEDLEEAICELIAEDSPPSDEEVEGAAPVANENDRSPAGEVSNG